MFGIFWDIKKILRGIIVSKTPKNWQFLRFIIFYRLFFLFIRAKSTHQKRISMTTHVALNSIRIPSQLPHCHSSIKSNPYVLMYMNAYFDVVWKRCIGEINSSRSNFFCKDNQVGTWYDLHVLHACSMPQSLFRSLRARTCISSALFDSFIDDIIK